MSDDLGIWMVESRHIDVSGKPLGDWMATKYFGSEKEAVLFMLNLNITDGDHERRVKQCVSEIRAVSDRTPESDGSSAK